MLSPAIRPIHMPRAPKPTGNASHQPTGMPTPQYANVVINIGTRVSLRPRNAPAAATWMPSENWNRPASIRSCAASEMTTGVDGIQRRDVLRHGQHQGRRDELRGQSQHEPDQARVAHAFAIAAADRVADAHGRRHRDAERHHERDRRDVDRDLMAGDDVRAERADRERHRDEQARLP